MGHYAYQDPKYDKTYPESTISSIWRSTYHASPAELQAAYASLNPTFLQRMQVRNTMCIREPLSATTTNTEHSSASANPARRSVSGMTNLLPLKLLSPNPSDNVVWPSSAPFDRTTFGMRLSLKIEGRCASMTESNGDRPLAQRLKKNRDIPIYTEPGTPLPGLAYFSHGVDSQQRFSKRTFGDDVLHEDEAEQRTRHVYDLEDLQVLTSILNSRNTIY